MTVLRQPELIETESPEEVIRHNLERALIRYGGDIQAYYTELLKKIPERQDATKQDDIHRLAALRLRANR